MDEAHEQSACEQRCGARPPSPARRRPWNGPRLPPLPFGRPIRLQRPENPCSSVLPMGDNPSDVTPTVWLSVRAASALLGVSPQTLRRWDRSGKLPAQRHPANNYRVYDEAELVAWMNEGAAAEGPPQATVAVVPPRGGLLVGREDAIDGIDQALRAGERLVVITGPPGVGKTRLARAWMGAPGAREAVFCAAGDCRTAEQLALAIGGALGAARAPTEDAMAREVERVLAGTTAVLVLDENREPRRARAVLRRPARLERRARPRHLARTASPGRRARGLARAARVPGGRRSRAGTGERRRDPVSRAGAGRGRAPGRG